MIEQRKSDPSQNFMTRHALARAWQGAVLFTGTALLPALVFAQAAPAAKPDPALGDKIAGEVCAACHGPDGNSTAPENPKLASQHPDYLFKQLSDFKPKEGQTTAARVNAVMAAFAASLSEADMHNVAAFYAAQPLKPSAARDKDSVERGQAIYRAGIASKGVPACSSCHGPRGEGIPAQYPVLHGQYSDYTSSQLVAFRSGARGNNQPMADIAGRLSDPEIKAVADYVAGLR